MQRFVPASKPMRFPLGREGRLVSQIEFYERLTDKRCDLRDIAAVTEPVMLVAQMQPIELCDIITNCPV